MRTPLSMTERRIGSARTSNWSRGISFSVPSGR